MIDEEKEENWREENAAETSNRRKHLVLRGPPYPAADVWFPLLVFNIFTSVQIVRWGDGGRDKLSIGF